MNLLAWICLVLNSIRKCKELSKLDIKKRSNPTKKWAKDLKRQFTEEDMWKAINHTKSYSMSLDIREMRNIITMK